MCFFFTSLSSDALITTSVVRFSNWFIQFGSSREEKVQAVAVSSDGTSVCTAGFTRGSLYPTRLTGQTFDTTDTWLECRNALTGA